MTRHLADELISQLRARIEASTAGESFDADAALATLRSLEQTTELLRRVSLDSFEAFESRINELSLLSSVGRVFVSIFELDQLCDALLEVVGEAIPCENAFLYLRGPARELDLKARTGPAPAAADLEAAESIGSMAIAEGELLCVPSLAVGPRLERLADPERARSMLACPLQAMGELFGAIVLSESREGSFSLDRGRVLRPVADFAALSIRHARVCARNLEHQEDLEALVERRTREVGAAREALSRHERTAAMGKLAASIAHEVNNPMAYLASNVERSLEYSQELQAAISGLVELQRGVLELPASTEAPVEHARSLALRAGSSQGLVELIEDFGELLSETRDAVRRIQQVGDDLRGFAQGINGAMEPLNLNGLVETALHIVRAEAKARVRLEFRPGVLPDVPCQQYQITQVLVNLLQNGVESIEGEGELRISTRVVESWVEVEVEDDGCGIPADRLDEIFEPFLTTKLAGTGLGLSIARDIALAHNGSLVVHSSPSGSTFTLRLAIGGPDRASAAAPEG